MRSIGKFRCIVASILLCFPLMACSADADSVYEYASEALGEPTDEELSLLAQGKLGVYVDADGISYGEVGAGGAKGGLYGMLTALCSAAKKYGPYVIIASVLIGFILLRLAPKAIRVRRTAWLLFIIGIPILTLFLIFGTAVFADAFAP